jgi:7-carboxy-7-deazaguanine synthase
MTEQEKVNNTISDKKIPLMEMFGPTFQGEGVLCGTQTYFMRFGLCDYKCTMCDSIHAVDPVQVKARAEWLDQGDIFVKFGELLSKQGNFAPAPWMTFSGGNPAIHDLTDLVRLIKRMSLQINVETQGTLCPAWLLDVDLVTISPKSPGMGEKYEPEKFKNMVSYLAAHGVRTCIKVVVFGAVDLEFAAMVFADAEECYPEGYEPLHFMSQGNMYPPQHPNTDTLGGAGLIADNDQKLRLLGDFRMMCEDILKDARFRDVTFLPQLHVLTWANKAEV